MKNKLFALLLATICLISLVACGDGEDTDAPTNAPTEAPTSAPCVQHKDENTDKVCDVCKLAMPSVATPTEPAEEETDEPVVDMIVKPLPTNAKAKDYLNVKYTNWIPTFNTADKDNVFESGEVRAFGGNLLCIVTTDTVWTGSTRYTTKIVNPALEKVLFTNTNTGYETDIDTYVKDGLMVVFGAEKNGKYVYYSANGTILETFDAPADVYFDDSDESDLCYVTIEDKMYVIDAFSGKVIVSGADKNLLTKRPAFDGVSDNYAYILNDNAVYIYNLAEWLDCVYSYKIPGYYTEVATFMLQNGNVLLQAYVQLADNAVSYDVLSDGDKYNIDYIMINPKDKTTTAVEFGYEIQDVQAMTKDMVTLFGVTSKVENYFEVYPIVNSRVDTNNLMRLFVTNALDISFDYGAFVPEMGDDMVLVADNRFATTVYLDEFTSIDYLYDETGKKLSVVPNTALWYDTYILVDNIVYDYSMKPLLDIEKNGYDLVSACENYLILEKEGVAYYFDSQSDTPLPLYNDENSYLVNFTECYFTVVRVDDEGDRLYTLYANNGEVIGTFDKHVEDCLFESDDIIRLIFNDGSTIFVKAK